MACRAMSLETTDIVAFSRDMCVAYIKILINTSQWEFSFPTFRWWFKIVVRTYVFALNSSLMNRRNLANLH